MPKRPNILFLFSDQHSPHVTGFEGNAVIDTPNLDRLAAQGVVFNNAYCQNPLCVPSRCSVITVRYCRNIGIYDNQHIVEQNCVTFPRVLSAAGYRTCLIGKSHFNGEQFHGYQQRPYGDLYGQAHQPDPGRTPERGAAGLGGVSLIPSLTGNADLERDAIFSESTVLKHPTHAGCMIRTGNWKYACYLDGAEELYDLAVDPEEWDNLAGEPDVAALQADLRRRVVAFWEPDQQMDRFNATPSMAREKHFYEFSNQFILGDGTVVDARP